MDIISAILAIAGAGLFAAGFALGRRQSMDVATMYAAGWRGAIRDLQTPVPGETDADDDGEEWKRGQAGA